MHDITVRQMDFHFPDELDPVVVPGEPEESFQLVAFSLLLPYLEPYLIRTMKEARKRVTDPELVADLEHFNAQEGHHFRQHTRFNETIRRPRFAELERYERELEADYRRFTKTKSLRFNLAFAEGFEALTTAVALYSFARGSAVKAPACFRDLWAWHLAEELEHRTVAFDVYEHVCGGYPYRLAVGTYAQWHTLRFIFRVGRYLFEAEGALETYGGKAAQRERLRRQRATARQHGLLGKILRTYSPWYTPHRIEWTPSMQALSERYSAMALSTTPPR